MDRFLPIDRLYENTCWQVFEHPRPEHPLQFLLLPKQPIQSLMDAPLETPEVYQDLLGAVQVLIQRYGLNTRRCCLVTNGGPNQSISQWRWHLISETPGDVND